MEPFPCSLPASPLDPIYYRKSSRKVALATGLSQEEVNKQRKAKRNAHKQAKRSKRKVNERIINKIFNANEQMVEAFIQAHGLMFETANARNEQNSTSAFEYILAQSEHEKRRKEHVPLDIDTSDEECALALANISKTREGIREDRNTVGGLYYKHCTPSLSNSTTNRESEPELEAPCVQEASSSSLPSVTSSKIRARFSFNGETRELAWYPDAKREDVISFIKDEFNIAGKIHLRDSDGDKVLLSPCLSGFVFTVVVES